MKFTLREKYLAALKSLGWVQNHAARTEKYIEMVHPEKSFKVYLGPSGAARRGNTVAGSTVLRDDEVRKLLVRGERLLNPPAPEEK
jgi:hypothetical protein